MDDHYEDIIELAADSRNMSFEQIEYRASVDPKFYLLIEQEYQSSENSRVEDLWNGENRE